MTLSLLLQGLSRYTTKIGVQEELIRLAPDTRLPAECRKVDIAYSLITIRKTSVLPWVKEEVVESWSIQATIRRQDGRKYTVRKLLGTELNRAIEVVMLEVTRKAVLDEINKKRQTPLAPRPVRMR